MRKSGIRRDVLKAISKGKEVSGGALASKLGVSRTAVWKAINSLRAEGFFISGGTGGYTLSPYNTKLCCEQLTAALEAENAYFKEVTDSTNEDIKRLANLGAEEFTIVMAKKQTGGKGRMARTFFSPEGGLYFSVLLRPRLTADTCLKITTAAAVSMAAATEKVTGLKPKIKWVNDIYIKGKKVCGILTEGAFDAESAELKYAVLGLGVNVATPKGGFSEEIKNKAGALFETSTPPSLVYFALINEFLREFKAYYSDIENMPHIEKYRAYSLLDGKKVTYQKDKKTYEGTVLGIGDEGELIVKQGGNKIPLSSGEVSITDYE